MAIEYKITHNWLTQKPNPLAFYFTFLISAFVVLLSSIYLQDWYHLNQLMAVSQVDIKDYQFWRLLTALFVHADFGHLISNLLLFMPLSFLLLGYYGYVFFPIFGVLSGVIVNFVTILFLPPETQLLGISGLVYWMGAAWLTLFILIDTRKSLRLRFGVALFLAIILFAPETYKPQVSYESHFFGFGLGAISALIYYRLYRNEILKQEVKEISLDETFIVSNSSASIN